MKYVVGFIIYTLVALIVILKATQDVLMSQYLLYLISLIGFVIAGNEVIKYESKITK